MGNELGKRGINLVCSSISPFRLRSRFLPHLSSTPFFTGFFAANQVKKSN